MKFEMQNIFYRIRLLLRFMIEIVPKLRFVSNVPNQDFITYVYEYNKNSYIRSISV